MIHENDVKGRSMAMWCGLDVYIDGYIPCLQRTEEVRVIVVELLTGEIHAPYISEVDVIAGPK